MGNFFSKIDYSVRLPYDQRDPRFVRSFSLDDDPEAIRQFYEDYGLVVFDNVLESDEIERSIDDLWSNYPGADRHDVSTWDKVSHPFSFAGEKPTDGTHLWNNRQHPNVYRSFKLLYELTSGPMQEPLVACLDRGSIMLPVEGPQGKPDWTIQRIPHFDLNPFVWHGFNFADNCLKHVIYENYNLMLAEGNNITTKGKYPKLRAVLQLSESTDRTGGFECLPGFHKSLYNWCKSQQATVTPGKQLSSFGWGVPTNDPIERNLQKITVRAGSLIVFSAELPHTMYPNESDQFRYAQYLRMTPLSGLELTEEMAERRRDFIRSHLPSELPVSEIGREVFLLREE